LAKRNDVKLNIDGLIRKKLIQKALDGTTSMSRGGKKPNKWFRVPYLGFFPPS